MLKISRMPLGDPEIFHSFQGEGVTAGTPSVFLRLAMCNLTCTWCDTKYTWDWQNFNLDDEVVLLSNQEVERRILSFDCKHLIITGGEPLLQQQALAPLLASLVSQGFYSEIETNGTLIPQLELVEAVAQWNVSPKLANSRNQQDRREIPGALVAFRELRTAYFKFVVSEPEDVKEVSRFIDRYDISPQRVILMPEGVTAQVIEERGKWVAKACLESGFRFSTRLHILLWGDERGR